MGFNWHNLREEVTLVEIEVRHCIVVGAQTLVEFLLVIHLAFFHAKHIFEIFGWIYGVAHPVDA